MRLFISTLLTLLLFSCSTNNVETDKVEALSVLYERVHQCSRLKVGEVAINKIISYEDSSKLNVAGKELFAIPGERKLMIPIEVKMNVFVDLTCITKDDIAIGDSIICINLPSPSIEISSTKIDHNKEQESVSFFRSNFSEKEKEAFMKQGIEEVKKDLPNLDVENIAKSNTLKIIKSIVKESGFKQTLLVSFEDKIENPIKH